MSNRFDRIIDALLILLSAACIAAVARVVQEQWSDLTSDRVEATE